MPLDESLFAEHMRNATLLEMVLKGHLWVESCLNRALEISLVAPNRAEIDRLPFAAKLNLCIATGAIPSDESLAALAEQRIGIPATLIRTVLAASLNGQSTITDPAHLLGGYIDAAQKIWHYVDRWRA